MLNYFAYFTFIVIGIITGLVAYIGTPEMLQQMYTAIAYFVGAITLIALTLFIVSIVSSMKTEQMHKTHSKFAH
jgi:sulfite exporter TauE/SafE